MLAHHWLEAAEAGDPPRAIDFAMRAAGAAVSAGAHGDAVDLYRRALELCEDDNLAEYRRELLVDLAEALLWSGAPEAVEAAVEAVEAARAADDAQRWVRSATLVGMNTSPSDVGDARAVAVMTEALARAGEDMPRDRALLLSRLAYLLMFEQSDRRLAYAEESVTLAREVDDPELLAQVFVGYLHAISNPENLDRRLVVAHEAQEVAARIDNPVLRWYGLPVQPAWEAGQLEWVERNDADGEAILESVPFPHGRATNVVHRAKRALFDGRVAAAERDIEEMMANYVELGGIFPLYAAQIGYIRCEQGRAGEMVGLVAQMRDQMESRGAEPLIRSFEAFVALEADDQETAAEMLRAEAAAHFAEQERDSGFYAYPRELGRGRRRSL